MLVIALIAVVTVGALLVARHVSHRDDPQRIMGEWRVEGANMTMVIDEDAIRLPDNVQFSYTIDPDHETLELTNGSRTGTATYRLADHDTTMVLTEELPTSATNDQGETVEQTQTRQLVLTRISYDRSMQPKLLDASSASAASTTSAAGTTSSAKATSDAE